VFPSCIAGAGNKNYIGTEQVKRGWDRYVRRREGIEEGKEVKLIGIHRVK